MERPYQTGDEVHGLVEDQGVDVRIFPKQIHEQHKVCSPLAEEGAHDIQGVLGAAALYGYEFLDGLDGFLGQVGYPEAGLFGHIGHGNRATAGPTQDGNISPRRKRQPHQGGQGDGHVLKGMDGDKPGLAAEGLPDLRGPGQRGGVGLGGP